MALEDLTGLSKYINSLVVTNPPGATDYLSEADDHLRGIKNVIKNTFPSLTGAVTATHVELSKLAGIQSFMGTFLQAATTAAARSAIGVDTAISTATSAINSVPTGSVTGWAGSSAPSGWLLCYGQEVSRTTYADLYTAIGDQFGAGDGSTTFNIPDCRGRVMAGFDAMGGASADRLTDQSGGVDGDTLGAVGGAETHTLTVAELAAHTHGAEGQGSDALGSQNGPQTRTNTSTTTTDSTGSGAAHNNVQPTIVFNMIIRT